ncbi:hypothetical protein MTBPR1_50027 [Candidatus Terasakiella magnetica]|uniref:Thioesterase domain-containing protein n=1 Tax=Candidatus Terasakiella magnetica TaxID=1867952 RepID=A0A1C3RJ37_9PROT|nr:PaaI family thioesterase [Candidatus Terasakiella magnetica]SCA57271.1 hypothetical protein MTBPR1_50027 [Candidatus Terasakiella magnetica]
MSTSLHNFMRQTVENLPHCKKLGLRFEGLSQGQGCMFLQPRAELVCNKEKNLLHSAIVTTLLDTLCGTVASSVYPEGRTVATLDLRLDHLRSIKGDQTLYGRAECFHFNEDVAYVRSWAWQGDESHKIATATGTFKTNGTFQLQLDGESS